MSVRESASLPSSCSGAMYWNVPTIAPSPVSFACSSVISVSASASGADAKHFESAPLADALTEMTLEQAKLTGEGAIVGTFQYMAPEQLEGKEADSRTDIFALGEVIYEMATGKPAFAGKSRASLIAAILTTEPQAMTALQPMTPPALERVVKKCLAKDPDERWQSASDLASELRWIGETGSQAGEAQRTPGRRRWDGATWLLAPPVFLLFVAPRVG